MRICQTPNKYLLINLKPILDYGSISKYPKTSVEFYRKRKNRVCRQSATGWCHHADKIAKFVAQDTGARPAQVKMILDTLVESMMDWIEEGHGVKLGNFGSFMPTVKSASSEVADEAGVKRVWVTFYAGKELKERLDDVKYSTENEFAVNEENNDNDSSSGETPSDEDNSNSGESNPL